MLWHNQLSAKKSWFGIAMVKYNRRFAQESTIHRKGTLVWTIRLQRKLFAMPMLFKSNDSKEVILMCDFEYVQQILKFYCNCLLVANEPEEWCFCLAEFVKVRSKTAISCYGNRMQHKISWKWKYITDICLGFGVLSKILHMWQRTFDWMTLQQFETGSV